MPDDLRSLAASLLALHVPGSPLILPNVWDVPSAQAVVAAGYPVVATSSEAVAQTLGYRDGQEAPAALMLAAAARIARAIDVPLSIDAEAGYGMTPADLVVALLTAGAAGCNLEDTDHDGAGLREVGAQADFLSGVRAAADDAGVHLVVNARVDVFLQDGWARDPEAALAAAVERGRCYGRAGADCVYPILLHDPALAARFCAAMAPMPVNLLGSPTRAAGRIQLGPAAAAGAARVSFGPDLWRATMLALAALIPPGIIATHGGQ